MKARVTFSNSFRVPMAIPLASEANGPIHFVLFPFMAQGHMIPMVDIAKLLAQRGLIVTIVTTHKNAARFQATLDRAIHSGLQIRLAKLRFPSEEAGLPKGCENLDMLPNHSMVSSFFAGTSMLRQPAEDLLDGLVPRPSCIISDMCFPWTLHIADKLRVPRITFSGFGSFHLSCTAKVLDSNLLDTLESDTEPFVVPGIPDHIVFTKDQMSLSQDNSMEEFVAQIGAADKASYGAIVNSFEELEPAYAEEYKKVRGGKAWCIGPVSLCNEGELDKAERGKKSDINEHECLKWLDSWPQGCVVYVCMGSLCNIVPSQMVELGLGLEASGRPFVWAIRGGNRLEEVEKWVEEDGFEERVKGRGLLIRGWAPQVVILSHPWPLFGDQFGNQKLVEQVLGIGVGVGVEVSMKWGEEEKIGVLVKRGDVERAVKRVMDEGEEGEERRRKARELGELAKRAMDKGGSSYNNLSLLIQDVVRRTSDQQLKEIT